MAHLKAILLGTIGSALAGALAVGLGAEKLSSWLIAALVGVVVFLVVEWWGRRAAHPRLPVSPSPEFLPSPTQEELHRAALESIWGEARYRAKSTWNDAKRLAFLQLRLRDDVPIQGYRVLVFDPTGIRSETSASQMVTQGSIVETYPEHFRDAPPLISGDYTVVWYALVSDSGAISMQEVARDQFEVPSSSPAIS